MPGRAPRSVRGVPRSPQAPRVEARDDHVPLGHEDARHLPHHLVRVVAELQHVRQQDQVRAQLLWIGSWVASPRMRTGPCVSHPAAKRDAVGAQKVEAGEPELKGIEAEDVHHFRVEVGLLGSQQIASQRRLEPVGGQRVIHQIRHQHLPHTRSGRHHTSGCAFGARDSWACGGTRRLLWGKPAVLWGRGDRGPASCMRERGVQKL